MSPPTEDLMLPATQQAARAAPRASNRAARFGIAVLCPLATAAIAVFAVGPAFRGTVAISLEGGAESVSLSPWVDRLTLFVSREVSPDAEVRFDPTDALLRITIERPRLSELRQSLQDVGVTLTARVAKLSDDAVAEATRLRQPLLDERYRIRNELASLDDPPGGEATDAEPADPFEQLLRAVGSAEDYRMALARLRARQDDVQARREEMLQAPIPSAASVDPEARRQAYSQDEVLQEDLRHLEVQLAQIRSALLEIQQNATGKLEAVLNAAKSLEDLLEAPEAIAATGDLRAALERVVGLAADHRHRTTRFAQVWTESFVSLKDMAVDPMETKLLDASDRLAESVREHVYESTAAISGLRNSLNNATEEAERESQGHALSAVALRRFRELEAAERSFDSAASDTYARDNYLLDAARHTARALIHRTSRIRDELDTGLNDAARERARARRQQDIAELTAELASIRAETSRQVDDLLAVQDRIKAMATRAPDEVRVRGDLQLARQKQAWLNAHAEEVDTALGRLVDPSAAGFSARVVELTADDAPANLTVLLVAGGAVWAITFLGLALMWRLSPG